MKQLPNTLSFSRILVCLALFFLTGYPVLFTILYLISGVSDVLDGYLARRWKVESQLGAKLDSLGDFVMYTLIVFVFITHTHILNNQFVVWTLIFIFIGKLINFLLIKIRFKQWSMLHTWADKFSGLIVYLALPVYILYPETPSLIVAIICGIALLATIEEMLIILTSTDYDVNKKSYFN